jgi:hypothetical protein
MRVEDTPRLRWNPRTLRRTARAALTAIVVVASAFWTYHIRADHPTIDSDLMQVVWGARAWLEGQDPYAVVGRSARWPLPLIYPFPAILLAVPFAALSDLWLNVLWSAVSAAWLTWMLTSDGFKPSLVMLVSAAYILALQTSQWTPLLLAATLSRWGGALLACKPTTGLFLLAYRPTLRHVLMIALAVALSLLLWPRWPFAWATTWSEAIYTVWPLTLMGAPLVLLAAKQWRRAEARLLVATVCVPHTTFVYETLPLFMVPATWVEAGILWLGSYIAVVGQRAFGPQSGSEWTRSSGQWLVWCVYLPATVMVLRHDITVQRIAHACVRRWRTR